MRNIALARVFFLIESETKGLEKGLESAERSLGRTAKFILANPVAAAGAMGVALLGVAAKAAEMAEEVDVAFRKVGALVPDLTQNLAQAQRAVAELAVTTGKSQAQLVQEAEAIASHGVSGTTDLLNRLRVLQDLADASGADVTSLAGGLDQTLDVFGLAADKAGEVGAKLFAIAQGKAPLEDLFAALQRAAPSVLALGLDFDTTAAALGALLDQGLNAKQAGAALKALADGGTEGAARLRELAGAGIDAADAFARLAEADRLVRESASRSAAGIRQELNNELIQLGTAILPTVNIGLRTLVGLLDTASGRIHGIKEDANLATARTLATALAAGRIDIRSELDVDKVQRFADAVRSVRQGIAAGRMDLAALSREELAGLQQALEQYQRLSASQQRGTLDAQQKQGTTSFRLDTEADMARGVAQLEEIRQTIATLLQLKSAAGAGSASGGLTPEQQTAIDAFQRKMEDTLVGFTSSAVDNTVLALKRFREEAAKAIAGLPAAEAEAMQRQVDAVVAGFKRQIEDIKGKELADALIARNAPLTPSVAGGKVPLRTSAIDKANAALVQEAKDLAGAERALADERAKAIAAARAQYQAIETATRGALQIASALGIMNDNLASALTGLVQFAAGLKEFKALQSAGASPLDQLSAGLGLVGGAVSAIGAIGKLFGLGGPSPEEVRAQEIQKANTAAIEELTRNVGDLGTLLSGTSGAQIGAVQQALETGLGRSSSGIAATLSARSNVEAELRRLGLSMNDLREVAKGLGIAFAGANPTARELQQTLEALKAAELTQFADSVAGQMQALALQFRLFDVTDPIEQLKLLQAEAKKFAGGKGPSGQNLPEVFKTLSGLDLGTEAGRAAADAEIKRIFTLLQSGGLTPAQLGGFSTQQLLDFLAQFKDTLTAAAKESAPQGQTQGFNVSRTITEVQANLLASLLGTDTYWNEQTARNTAAIAAALGASIPTGSLAPPATSTGAAGGVTTIDLTLYLSLPGVPDLATATAIGGSVADGLANTLDAVWGTKLRTRKLLSGSVVQV